jgi:hypothetical protein
VGFLREDDRKEIDSNLRHEYWFDGGPLESILPTENVQAVWVWRFKPPFGSLQFAFQRGSSEQGQVSEQGNTLFSKFAWVF